jgi:hypothetical protein
MYKSLVLGLFVIFALPAFARAAPIYRCAGAGGATVFSQVPCGTDSAQVGPNGAKKPAAAAGADSSNDKAALAEIETRCEAQSHRILDGYSARFAEANAAIADLHKHLMASGAGGTEKDPAVHKQITALEAKKTDLLDSQDHELSALRNQCQADRNAELKRETDRDATHAVVKR